MTRRRARVWRRAVPVLVDTIAVVGGGCALVLLIVGAWLVLAGEISLAAGAWGLP